MKSWEQLLCASIACKASHAHADVPCAWHCLCLAESLAAGLPNVSAHEKGMQAQLVLVRVNGSQLGCTQLVPSE